MYFYVHFLVFFQHSYYLPQTPNFLQRLRTVLGFVAAYFWHLIQNFLQQPGIVEVGLAVVQAGECFRCFLLTFVYICCINKHEDI